MDGVDMCANKDYCNSIGYTSKCEYSRYCEGWNSGKRLKQAEINQLQFENDELKARLEKAVEFAIYVNNQFGYCMPNEFFDKYYGLMGEPPKE